MSQSGFFFPLLNYLSKYLSDPFVLGMLSVAEGSNEVGSDKACVLVLVFQTGLQVFYFN